MFEFNCDKERDFVLTNYSLCFGAACSELSLRMGDYKLVDNQRRVMYDPLDIHGHPHTHTTAKITFPTTTVPNLPAHMLRGVRRFTPHGHHHATKTKKPHTRKITRKTTTPTTKSTIVLKRITFWKNGRNFVKIVKGVPTETTKKDSDFLE